MAPEEGLSSQTSLSLERNISSKPPPSHPDSVSLPILAENISPLGAHIPEAIPGFCCPTSPCTIYLIAHSSFLRGQQGQRPSHHVGLLWCTLGHIAPQKTCGWTTGFSFFLSTASEPPTIPVPLASKPFSFFPPESFSQIQLTQAQSPWGSFSKARTNPGLVTCDHFSFCL